MIQRIVSVAAAFLFATTVGLAAEKVDLREQAKPGDAATVSVEFKAKGELHVPTGEKKGTALSYAAQGRFAFEEKELPVEAGPKHPLARVFRYYTAAAVQSTVEEQRTVRELREPVRLVGGEFRGDKPFLFSPAGPLTGDELELLEGPLDPLVIGGLLPPEPVEEGDTWKPAEPWLAAVLNLSSVTKSEVQGKVEALDDATARIALAGKLEGIHQGAEVKLDLQARVIFDRQRDRISRIELTLADERTPGLIDPGSKIDASFTLVRNLDAPLSKLNDDALQTVPVETNPATELLAYIQPDGRFRFYYPRGWHVYRNDPHLVVLRLIENGEFVAQCNVSTAPTVAAGTHMKAEDFKSQVQQALGRQFQQFIQEGEAPAEKGHWVYRLAAAGAAGELPVVWYYFLAAGPQGQQLVFTFTLAAKLVDQFGAKDLSLVGSVEFDAAKTAAKPQDRK